MKIVGKYNSDILKWMDMIKRLVLGSNSKPRFTHAMREPCGSRTQAYGPLKYMEWFTHTAAAGRCRRLAALAIAVRRPCGSRKCLTGHCTALDGSH